MDERRTELARKLRAHEATVDDVVDAFELIFDDLDKAIEALEQKELSPTMGVFDEKQDDIITIRDEKNWEPHEQCRVRTVTKVSDFEWVHNQLVLIKQSARSGRRGAFARDQGMDIQTQTGASDRLWVYRMLKSWTFTKGNQPVPLTLAAVQQLPQSVLNFIYNEIQKRQPKEEEEPEADDKEGEKKEEEGSAFFDDALSSIDGDTAPIDEERPQEQMASSRNYLSKL